MKRKLILLIPVLFLMLNLAGAKIIEVPEAVGGVQLIGGGTPVGGEAGCVSGTTFSYNGDHSSGVTYACDSGGNGLAPASNTADSVTSSYVEFNAVDEHLLWTLDEDDEISDSQGTIWLSAFVVDDGDIGTNNLIEMYMNSSNYMSIQTDNGSNDIYIVIRGNAQTATKYSVNNMPRGSWERIGFTWQTGVDAGGKFSIYTATGGGWEESVTDIDDFGVALTKFSIGEDSSGIAVSDTVRVKDVSISSGYQDADPV